MTSFEQATLEQLVSYRAKKSKDIMRWINSPELKQQAQQLVQKWNNQRIKLGLAPW